MLLATVTCVLAAETAPERLPVFRVDTQDRTNHAIGADLGRQWKSAFPDLEHKLDSLLDHRLKGVQLGPGLQGPPYLASTHRPEDSFSGAEDAFIQELQGLASVLNLVGPSRLGDAVLSWDELVLVQRLPDLGASDPGCAFGVYGSRSQTGSPLIGRNLDAALQHIGMARELQAITVYRGKKATLVNIGFAGNLGVSTGFNRDGLFLAFLPVREIPWHGEYDAAGEPLGFALRRVLEAHKHVDAAAQSLSRRIDNANYSILMADIDQVRILEHAAGKPGRLRGPLSKPQPGMEWRRQEQIAAVGCFALSEMPFGCRNSLDRYRWQRFRTLAQFDSAGATARIDHVTHIMLDPINRRQAIYSDHTYQVLIFSTQGAELYLGITPRPGMQSLVGDRFVAPRIHRYADLMPDSKQQEDGIMNLWIAFWLLIGSLAIITLWIRLRSSAGDAPSSTQG